MNTLKPTPSPGRALRILLLALPLFGPMTPPARSADVGSVQPPPTAPRMGTPQFSAGGMVKFPTQGEENDFVLLQASTNLRDWTTVSGAWVVDGLAILRDVPPIPSAHRFYRALGQPSSFTLSGLAFDFWNDRPMAEAVVHLDFGVAGIPAAETITGPDGRFLFVLDLPFPQQQIPYTLRSSPPGYDLWVWTGTARQGDHVEEPIVFRDNSVFPPNNSFADRTPMHGDQSTVVGYNWFASSEFGEPEHDVLGAGPTGRASVWWSYTPSHDGKITLRSLGSRGMRAVAVYTGPSVTSLSRVTGEQAEPGNPAFSVTFRGTKGVEYSIAVDSLDNSSTTIALELRFSPTPEAASYQVNTIAGDPFPKARDGVGRAARFSGPAGLARNPKGDLWLADWENQLVRQVSPGGKVTTIAGLSENPGAMDGTGAAARFNSPSDLVFDRSGNAYLADYGNHAIRRITPDGGVTTLAGKAGQAGFLDGPAGSARFHNPSGIAIDRDGTLYVAEAWNHTVRRISPQGDVTTLAGAPEEPGHADGPGLLARFDMPSDVESDGAGTLYVADSNNHVIRKITPNGRVSTIAGQPHTSGSNDGNSATALLDRPVALALDSLGNLAFVQGDHTVRELSPDGPVVTLAGLANVSGSADGPARKARFKNPAGIVSDGQGGWWIDDFSNNTLRLLSSAGQVTTLAGLAVTNAVDGVGSAARFNGPSGVALETSGSVIVGDWVNQTVRRILPSGEVTTLAGMPGTRGSENGKGPEARFSSPADVAVSPDGTIVLAEWDNHTLRRITPDGRVSTIAGDPEVPGWEDGTGAQAHFVFPSGICTDGAGNIYVADAGAHVIRRVTPEGVATTVAGTGGVRGSVDANGLDASFDAPSDVAIDDLGNLFVADSGNHVIRRIAPDGMVSTFAGAPGEAGGVDGTASTARFNAPALLSFGPGRMLYVVESSHTLRRIDPSGLVETLAGKTGEAGYFDGPGPLARFRFPSGLAVNASGTAIVADYGNNVIRTVSALGEARTLAGLAVPGAVDGAGANVRFDGPAGLTVNPAGVLYVADWNNATVRRISPDGGVTTLAGSAGHPGTNDGTGRFAQFIQPADVALDSHGNLFVVDAGAHTVRKVTPQGDVSTVAGLGGEPGSSDGRGAEARFNNPGGIGIGPDDTLYVADSGNNTVRRIDVSGLVSTIAGSPGIPGHGDGPAADARFTQPSDIAVDAHGTLYVADASNNSIRRITPQAEVSTLAGYRGRPGTADGATQAVRFHLPISLAIDPQGNLIVADYLNLTVRRVTPAGEATTLAGAPGFPSLADGTGAGARFKAPGGIAIDRAGVVYISDFTGNVIRKGRPAP